MFWAICYELQRFHGIPSNFYVFSSGSQSKTDSSGKNYYIYNRL